jgi:carotenoid cleavage dioxygenase
MARPFPTGNSFLEGGIEPWPMEGEIADVIVEGEIPAALRGTYYRNGANPQYAQLPSYHIFDGDGMIHAFRFEDGRCAYKNRWVRTDRFLAERKAGERIFRGLMGQQPPDPRAFGVSGNTANTHILSHAGHLLALWEGGPPYALEPDSLETIGVHDFGGRLLRDVDPAMAAAMGRSNGKAYGSVTAHPKIDPETGEMLFFGYSLIPPFIRYGEVDPSGELTRWIEIDSPHGSMLHDFIVTAEHVVFPVFPNTFSPENLAKTGSPLAWEPERGTHFGVMPRGGDNDDIVWVRADACNVFHFMNAHSEGPRVVVEACRFDALPLFGETPPLPTLVRWTIDPEAGSVKQEELDEHPIDFPRIDDRYAGLPYRHGWGAGAVDTKTRVLDGPAFNVISHMDHERGTRRNQVLPDGDVFGEPVFVPRSPDADEGEGFVLALAWRGAENRSDLMVLDAQNIDGEPLATVRLPHRVPLGFHGSWRPAD